MSRREAPQAPVRLLPDEPADVQRSGAVGSVQVAELFLPAAVSTILSRDFLSRAARGYWRYITRISLGVFRVAYARDHQSVVLLARPLVLLRFRLPDYEVLGNRGSVTWPIERGLLVSREGRDQGFLRMTIEPIGDRGVDAQVLVRVTMEVRNLYPWLRGSGRFARFGAWLYSRTQLRIHRLFTRGFLRSLARFDLPPSEVGAQHLR